MRYPNGQAWLGCVLSTPGLFSAYIAGGNQACLSAGLSERPGWGYAPPDAPLLLLRPAAETRRAVLCRPFGSRRTTKWALDETSKYA